MNELETQRARALERANATRNYRFRLHLWLRDAPTPRAACCGLAGLLETPELPPELRTLHAGTLLRWVRPHHEAELMLKVAGASTAITAGRLTERQRRLIAALLRDSEPWLVA